MKIRFLPLILLCLLLGGCSRAVAGGHLISAAEGSEEYCTVLNTFLPGYIPREPEDTLYADINEKSLENSGRSDPGRRRLTHCSRFT